MGIDVYMRWDGMTKAEEEAQFTGYSTCHGHVGYLREAYHGEPYATKVLVPEAFAEDAPDDGVHIPAKTLRERLPETLNTAKVRHTRLYKSWTAPQEVLDSFTHFVELAEHMEALGRKVRIHVSW